MNVKDLILCQPAADIAAALLDRLDVEPAKSSVTLSAKKNWASFCRRNSMRGCCAMPRFFFLSRRAPSTAMMS